jgi:hypothetical protein
MKEEERHRNCYRLEETKEIQQLNAMEYPGIEKGHECKNW